MNYRQYGSDAFNDILENYFNKNESNRRRYNIFKDVVFSGQSNWVQQALYQDYLQSSAPALEFVLNYNLSVLLYQGQTDLIVNTAGALLNIEELKWWGADKYNNRDWEVWKMNETVVGYKSGYANLDFRIINKAGHLVPRDQPLISRLMIEEYVSKVLKKLKHENSF